MKKNKTIAYLMAATLLVGGTFLGTKALFTDEEKVSAELAISTGDLDIVEVQNKGSQWTLDRNGAELSDGTTTNVVFGDNATNGEIIEDNGYYNSKELANNLKPGDVLTRTVTIKNQGTLVAKGINVKATKDDQLLDGLLTLGVSGLNNIDLNPGEEAKFTLTITVNDEDSKHNKTGKFNNDLKEDTVVDLINAWTLTATQQDEK